MMLTGTDVRGNDNILPGPLVQVESDTDISIHPLDFEVCVNLMHVNIAKNQDHAIFQS